MLIAFSVAPSGVGELAGADPTGSVSTAVAEAVRVVRESGLPHRTDSMFTTVEGEWDECMDVVKRACEVVGRYGSRVSLVLKADIRPGHTGELEGKVARVESALAGSTERSTSPSSPPSPPTSNTTVTTPVNTVNTVDGPSATASTRQAADR